MHDHDGNGTDDYSRLAMQLPSGRTVIGGLRVVVAAIAVGLSASGVERNSVVLFSIVAAMFLLPEAYRASVAWLLGRRSRLEGPGSPVGFAAIAAFLIVASVGLTHWPLRLAFAISRGALDDATRRIRAGEPIRTPSRIGLFNVREAELGGNWHAHIACFWTDLDPAGKTGFVQCGEGEPPFNLWSNLPLGGGWHLIAED
jgi:hypothetical protein